MAEGYQSLYRRYRPRTFSEVKGQDHVVRALRNAVREGRVGHAYLFSGPRGTGKTTSARLLAKVLNCASPVDGEPCGTCDACRSVESGRMVDWLQEHDAASNNRVEPMRDLLEKVPLGTSGNRKVIILDEVHMLTGGAANALLKTLEEPPDHVVFVLATTDPQKVLPTIRSRTQHLEFHLLPADELAAHVRHVIDDAGLGLGEDAVEHVLRLGGGSARDTLSALDQVAAMGGVVDEAEPLDAILTAVGDRDPGAVLVAVAEAVAAGRDVRLLGSGLIERLRNAFLAVMGAPDRHLPDGERAGAEALGAALGPAGLTRALEVVGEAMVELAKKPDPRIVLEVALVRLCRPDVDRTLDALLERLERLERSVASGTVPAPPGAPSDAPSSTRPGGAPAVDGPGPGDGPAAGARAELARRAGPVRGAAKKAVARPAAPVAAAADADAGTPGAAPSAAPAAAPVAPGPAGQAASGSAAVPPHVAAPAASPSPPPAAPPPTAPTGGGAASTAPPSRDELTVAWGERVLEGLPAGTKALFRMGRFVEGDGATAVFALPNAPHRDHCEKKRADVEAALGAHFGRPVPLRLVTDAEAGGPGAGVDLSPGGSVAVPSDPGSTGAAGPPTDDVADIGDVADLEDAPDAASGVDRLAQAFPGAELLEE